MRYGCEDPDLVPARIFSALGTDCPCCAFWRGVLIGFLLGLAAAALVYFTKS